MRYHVLAVLARLNFGGKEVTETQIISWANDKVKLKVDDIYHEANCKQEKL